MFVATALLWGYVFNPQFGLANAVLGWFGIPPLHWLNDTTTSKPSFIIMSLWGFGSAMVIFLAGLQGVPEALYEAASLDGAGRWARFRHVTLPMITPMVFFNMVLGIIGVVIGIALIALGLSLFNTPVGRNYQQCLQQAGGNPTMIQQCVDALGRQISG